METENIVRLLTIGSLVVPLRGGAMMNTGSRTSWRRKGRNGRRSNNRPNATTIHISQYSIVKKITYAQRRRLNWVLQNAKY